ncbi:hypothetical protein B4U80_00319 [Leptotrombidium deliense]|uniref:Uncharacterized protein n=1 Tax=Leptotrombidium deliense TaxID=299467 RepID=A0A443S6T8_9ACAR|nr:hypothetical protein B4U80_00319 [Leptotrombidium deliense]
MNFNDSIEIAIEKTWNDILILPDDVIKVNLSICNEKKTMNVEINAPFYNDPPPKAESGSLMGLWDFEVVEMFFLGNSEEYLELEFGPHNHFLVLYLRGKRNIVKNLSPLEYNAVIDGKKWSGKASIPLSFFPENVRKFNCYAIHGTGEKRTYLALFPTPNGSYLQPDFHRVEYFGDFKLALSQ